MKITCTKKELLQLESMLWQRYVTETIYKYPYFTCTVKDDYGDLLLKIVGKYED